MEWGQRRAASWWIQPLSNSKLPRFPYREVINSIVGLYKPITGWWFQPLWKICSSNWVHLPQFSGWKFQKSLSCHHLDRYWWVREVSSNLEVSTERLLSLAAEKRHPQKKKSFETRLAILRVRDLLGWWVYVTLSKVKWPPTIGDGKVTKNHLAEHVSLHEFWMLNDGLIPISKRLGQQMISNRWRKYLKNVSKRGVLKVFQKYHFSEEQRENTLQWKRT